MSNFARYAYLAGGEPQVPQLDLRPPAIATERRRRLLNALGGQR